MFQRFLSFLGPGGYHVPSLPLPRDTPEDIDGPSGEARFSFTSGPKMPTDAQSEDERRERSTDEDLVWPGKTTTIGLLNEENVAARFQLTVTDLDPAWYLLRRPKGGTRLPDESVLLPPGEEVVFEVCFRQPPAAGSTPETGTPSARRPQRFSFVVTCYDVRRSDDPGQIIGDLPARWVPLPDAGDLEIAARPPQVVLRPWRRAPRLQLTLQNRSYLPTTVDLHVLRAPTRAALAETRADVAGSLRQLLPARTPGVWRCLLPPADHHRASYFATVSGAARFGESGAEHALALPQPVYVRYVPWLRAFRDWIFLFASLFLLLWLTWGIPVRKAPTVRLRLVNKAEGGSDAGAPLRAPAGASLEDLKISLIPLDNKTEGAPIPGTPDENEPGVWEFALPAKWHGRKPWGWNWLSRAPRRFRVEASVRSEDTRDLWENAYALQKMRTEKGDTYFTLPASERPFWGPWEARRAAIMPVKPNIRLRLLLGGLGAARGRAERIEVIGTLKGEQVLHEEYPISSGGSTLDPEVLLSVKPGDRGLLVLTARTRPYQVTAEPKPFLVERRKQPYTVPLFFSPRMPEATLHFLRVGVPYVIDLSDHALQRKINVAGDATTVSWPIRAEGQSLRVRVSTRDKPDLYDRSYRLTTAPLLPDITIKMDAPAAPAPPPPPHDPQGGKNRGGASPGAGGDNRGAAVHPRRRDNGATTGAQTPPVSPPLVPQQPVSPPRPVPPRATAYELLLFGLYKEAARQADRTVSDKRMREAIKAYARVRLRGDRMADQGMIGRLCARIRDPRLARNPAYALALTAFGRIEARAGNRRHAAELYDTAIGKDPTCVLACTALAELYRESIQRHESPYWVLIRRTSELEKNSRLDPAALHYELARCWRWLGNQEKAREQEAKIPRNPGLQRKRYENPLVVVQSGGRKR